MAQQEFQAGVPVVVPPAFRLQRIDLFGGGAPAAVMLDGLLESAPVAASDITDDTVDIEQQDAGLFQ